MINEIIMRKDDRGNIVFTVCGGIAHKLYFKVLRGHLNIEAFYNFQGINTAWVLTIDGIVKAGQSTKENAMAYMDNDRVLLTRE